MLKLLKKSEDRGLAEIRVGGLGVGGVGGVAWGVGGVWGGGGLGGLSFAHDDSVKQCRKAHKYQCSLRMPKKHTGNIDQNMRGKVMAGSKETVVFNYLRGDFEPSKAELCKKCGLLMGRPSPKP